MLIIDTIESVLNQVGLLVALRLPDWHLCEDDEMGFAAVWATARGAGTITYSRTESERFFAHIGPELGYTSAAEHFAFALSREVGRALQMDTLRRLGLWEQFVQRCQEQDRLLNVKLGEYGDRMTFPQYIEYRRCFNARKCERNPIRVARLLTGLTPADIPVPGVLAAAR